MDLFRHLTYNDTMKVISVAVETLQKGFRGECLFKQILLGTIIVL